MSELFFQIALFLTLFFSLGNCSSSSFTESEIVSLMKDKSRAYFPFLFREGGFRTGMEIGVAEGRYSELFLIVNEGISSWNWYMVEPFPSSHLSSRYAPASIGSSETNLQEDLNWEKRGIGKNAVLHFMKQMSTDPSFVASVETLQLDFIYLDGAHDYVNVKKELQLLWKNVRPGGVMAGHDYCNYGERSLKCKGCNKIPKCRPNTPFGVANGKRKSGLSANQNDVVRAVQEWLVESQPNLQLYHTDEHYTKDSLAADGMDINLVMTHSYNPSWYIVKPL